MVFSNSVSWPDIQPLILNKKQIETIKECKFLGIVFTQTGKYTRAKGALVVQAKKVLYILRKIAKTFKSFPPVSVMCKLFDTIDIYSYCLFCAMVLRYGEWSNLKKLRKSSSSSANLYYNCPQEHSCTAAV